MALRDERGARHGRARLGSAGFVLLGVSLYLAAGAAATWPALRDADDSFLARGGAGHGEATPGDHLQSAYNLWLPGHQLEHGRAPWLDPYSFQPESDPLVNLQGLVFGFPYWPLERLLGDVGAWNVFTLLSYLLAGGLACAWLRALGLPRAAALAGGLAFALAPYRVAQSTGHMLGPVSALLALSLFGVEKARTRGIGWLVLGGAGLVAIPLSGQLHLALGAIPLFFAYALVRTKSRVVLAAAAAAIATGVGLLAWAVTVPGSVASGGRSLRTVDRYSAEWSDLVSRNLGSELEEFAFLGWLTPLLAVIGVAVLLARGQRPLAAVLGTAAVVPVVLALGTNLPTYEALWHALPPLRFPRVPERLLPIASLAIAGLVAFALARVRWRFAAALALPLLFLDLRVDVYRASAADPDNAAYSALRGAAEGRLLELPVILPQRHFGSPYLYYLTQAPRERPGGYSTVAPEEGEDLARRLSRLNCGYWRPDGEALLRGLDVRYVTVHDGLYQDSPVVPDCRGAARRGLRAHGFRPVARGGDVTLYERLRPPTGPPP
jgi:hypothetical protein